MFTEFSVENYKAFQNLDVKQLKRVNLVTGFNNSGKTCFLEALFLFSGATNPGLYLGLCNWRGDDVFNPQVDYPFRSSFYNQDLSNPITISAKGIFKRLKDAKLLQVWNVLTITPHLASGRDATATTDTDVVYGLDFEFAARKRSSKSKFFWEEVLVKEGEPTSWHLRNTGKASSETISARFLSPRQPGMLEETSVQLSGLIKQKRLDEIIELLKSIEPGLRSLTTISEKGRGVVYVDLGEARLLPLTSLGYGFFHYLRIALAALAVNNGVLLIDEIENGLHHRLLPKIVKFLFEIAEKNDIQLFFTTHSDEVVKAVQHYVMDNNYDDFEVIRFFNQDEDKTVSIYDASEMQVVDEISLELR